MRRHCILMKILQPNVQSKPQKEGSESEQFWDLLGGKTEYPSQKIGREAERDPHLFSCTFSKGREIAFSAGGCYYLLVLFLSCLNCKYQIPNPFSFLVLITAKMHADLQEI